MISDSPATLLAGLKLGVVLVSLVATPGCGVAAGDAFEIAGARYASDSFVQYKLPGSLREISGLALSATGDLLAHNDEQGIIRRIEVGTGVRSGVWQLGEPAVRDDFEGIAAQGTDIYLVTSGGTIYAASTPPQRQASSSSPVLLEYVKYPGRLPCEIEGLAHHPSERTLLAACKRIPDSDDLVRVYGWDIAGKKYLPEPLIEIAAGGLDELAPELTSVLKKLRPAGITVAPGNTLVLVGRIKSLPVLLELSLAGQPLKLALLPDSGRHRQPEGISIASDKTLFIADESGDKSKKGRLGVYRAE